MTFERFTINLKSGPVPMIVAVVENGDDCLGPPRAIIQTYRDYKLQISGHYYGSVMDAIERLAMEMASSFVAVEWGAPCP